MQAERIKTLNFDKLTVVDIGVNCSITSSVAIITITIIIIIIVVNLIISEYNYFI